MIKSLVSIISLTHRELIIVQTAKLMLKTPSNIQLTKDLCPSEATPQNIRLCHLCSASLFLPGNSYDQWQQFPGLVKFE